MNFQLSQYKKIQLLICFCLGMQLQSQSVPHSVSLNRNLEWGIGTGCLLWSISNYSIQFSSPQVVGHSRYWTVPGLDQLHYKRLNAKAARISDLSAAGTAIASAITFALQPKNEAFKKTLITAESVWLSANLSHSIKLAVQRNRPYTASPGFQFSKRDDRYSFFSQHSAVAAALVTSAICMRLKSGNGMSAKGQKLMPVIGLGLGLFTGWMRIYAGKHFPSDVVAGLISGTAIAYFNYRIHEN